MLAYRHIFHAGNFGDVVKHAVLAAIAAHLAQKDKPYFYLDTHAGAGLYRFDSPDARRLSEYRDGIARIWGATDAPPLLVPYLAAVAAANSSAALRCYPGSPLLVRHFMRASDRMSLHELHPADHAQLLRTMGTDNRVRISRDDGLHALQAELPARERRGLVLIDPSYEGHHDYRAVPQALRAGYRRFATGIFVVWYPLLGHRSSASLVRAMLASATQRTLHAELTVRPREIPGLYGCGVFVMNPPWGLAAGLTLALPWLVERIAQRHGAWRLQGATH